MTTPAAAAVVVHMSMGLTTLQLLWLWCKTWRQFSLWQLLWQLLWYLLLSLLMW